MKVGLLGILFSIFCNGVWAQTATFPVGTIPAEITMARPDGSELSLSSMKGKVVLLDFWASWGAPCVKEISELKKLRKEYQSKGFEIFGVSLDKDKERWVNTLKRFEIDWPQVSDLKFWRSQAVEDYNLEEIPYNYLLDENGRVIAVNLHGDALKDFLHQRFRGR